MTTDGEGPHNLLYKSGVDWLWVDGSSQLFETYGEYPAGSGTFRINSVADLDGNTLTYSYLGSTDKLDIVTTADGAYMQYVWVGNNIEHITTVAGGGPSTRAHYSYYQSNRLIKVTTELSLNSNQIADGNLYEVSVVRTFGTDLRL